MGILISLSPLVQFFVASILGALSDQMGRKRVLLYGLAIGCVSYALGVVAIYQYSIFLLFLSRILFGVSAATMPVVQAAIADMSTKETKSSNYGVYNMALGLGFTFGPFLGGTLSDSSLVSWFSPSTPFMVGAIATAINLLLIGWCFVESRKIEGKITIDIFKGLKQAKAALYHPRLRIVFLAIFLFVFGWDYYSEFISVTLKIVYNFTTVEIGYFYAYMGLLYAFCTGVVIKPLLKRFSAKKLLVFSMLGTGPFLMVSLFIQNAEAYWWFLPALMVLIALFYPLASTFISDQASDEDQGEILGIYHSVQALALGVGPLLSGTLTGRYPMMPILLGGISILGGGLVFAAYLARENKRTHRLDEGL